MKNAPKGKRRERRSGKSPYAKYGKTPYKYPWQSHKNRDGERAPRRGAS